MTRRDPLDDTGRIASRYSARVTAARERLAALMQERGLTLAAGWRPYEEIVNTPEGMAFLLRPVHRTEASPEDLRILVPLA
jgi:hypothetical protein